MVFYTFANTGVIHAEKPTTPERYLELVIGRHKSRSIERCLLLSLGAQLCLPLRPGYLQAPFVTPHNDHARSAVFLFKTRFFSLFSALWGYFIQLLYVFWQEICVLTLNLANSTTLHYSTSTKLNNKGGLGVCMGVLAVFQTSLPGSRYANNVVSMETFILWRR